MNILDPRFWLACIGILAIAFVSGYVTKGRIDKTSQQAAVASKYKADAQKVISAADKLEVKKDERQIIYKTITKEVDRLVPDRSACFSDDRLRIANNAIQATNTGQHDKPLPKSDATR